MAGAQPAGAQALCAPRLEVRRLLAEQEGDRADHLGGGAWGAAEPAGVRGVRSRASLVQCFHSTSREGTGYRHNAEGVTAAEYRPVRVSAAWNAGMHPHI